MGLVIYSLRVELTRTLYEGGGARRTAITWKQDMLGTVGEANLYANPPRRDLDS